MDEKISHNFIINALLNLNAVDMIRELNRDYQELAKECKS